MKQSTEGDSKPPRQRRFLLYASAIAAVAPLVAGGSIAGSDEANAAAPVHLGAADDASGQIQIVQNTVQIAENRQNGELVRNFDFEEAGTAEGTGAPPAWSVVVESGSEATIQLDSDDPLGSQGLHSLRLTVTRHSGRVGVANSGFEGVEVQPNEWFDLTFSARSAENKRFGLVVSLESADGRRVCARATIPEVGGAWKSYHLALHSRISDPNCRLVIAMPESGTIWLENVSLLRRKTVKPSPVKASRVLLPGPLGSPGAAADDCPELLTGVSRLASAKTR